MYLMTGGSLPPVIPVTTVPYCTDVIVRAVDLAS